MSTPISIEDLYKCFGILADAKEQAGQVRPILHEFNRKKKKRKILD